MRKCSPCPLKVESLWSCNVHTAVSVFLTIFVGSAPRCISTSWTWCCLSISYALCSLPRCYHAICFASCCFSSCSWSLQFWWFRADFRLHSFSFCFAPCCFASCFAACSFPISFTSGRVSSYSQLALCCRPTGFGFAVCRLSLQAFCLD